MKVVDIQGLTVHAAGRVLLQLGHLAIAEGERVALVGPNGAGKSTLLRVLTGFQRFDAGQVVVLGEPVHNSLQPAALRALRSRVGQVHQGLHLVPRLSARDNVLLGALARVSGWRSWLRWFPPALVAEADAALAAVGLRARADERVDRLSGGERQKLGIARLRLQQPRLILADEPTANLDPAAAAQACAWLAEAARGATLVTVVHQLQLLPLLADRVVGLQGGRIVFDEPLASNTADRLARLYEPAAPRTAAAGGERALQTRPAAFQRALQPPEGTRP